MNGESLEAKEEGTAPGGAKIYKTYKMEDIKIKCKHDPEKMCDYTYFSEKDAIGCLICQVREIKETLKMFIEILMRDEV